MPKTKEPDTAIVNVYDSEDCIPPHIDHHDFDRPFCTISLLSEESIMFGTKIISRGPGDFACDYQIPLPKGESTACCLNRLLKGESTACCRSAQAGCLKVGLQHVAKVPKQVVATSLTHIALLRCLYSAYTLD